MVKTWNEPTTPDNLQRNQMQVNRIKELEAKNEALRGQLTLNDTLHQEQEKELLKAITVSNRKVKKMSKQLENYRLDKKLIHMEEVVKNQGFKILELNKKINEYEMERMK